MGTKPAKVGHLAATLLKYAPLRYLTSKRVLRPLNNAAEWGKTLRKWVFHKKVFAPRGLTKFAKVGPPRARVKSAKVALTSYV